MALKHQVIGIVLIVMGVLPYLMEIGIFPDFFNQFPSLYALTPGGWSYQVILICLGVLLIWKFGPRLRVAE